jgi:hypothetical protein
MESRALAKVHIQVIQSSSRHPNLLTTFQRRSVGQPRFNLEAILEDLADGTLVGDVQQLIPLPIA